MRIRLYGGPGHGREYEISGDLSGFRVPKPREDGDSIATQTTEYRNTHCTDGKGVSLYVAPDYTQSLIGDPEIEAAARWIVEQHRSIYPNLTHETSLGITTRELRRLRSTKSAADPPEARLSWGEVVGVRCISVEISPGKVLGKSSPWTDWVQVYPSPELPSPTS